MNRLEQALPNDPVQDLVRAVDELVAHGHDDLLAGPSSPLGGEVQPNPLNVRRESDIRLLAEFGKSILNASGADRIRIRTGSR